MSLRQQVGIDLRWYWCGEAEGEMGLRSAYGAMVARLQALGARSSTLRELDPRCIEAAHRARRIARRLESLDAASRGVLLSAYGLRTDPPKDLEPVVSLVLRMPETEELKGLLRSSRPIQEWFFRLRRRVSRGEGRPGEASMLAGLLRTAEARLDAAERAYLGLAR